LCEKCFDFSHRSEKKKFHEKKEIKENFIQQKCMKHDKKLEFFCVKDETKCCSHCLISDHEFHDVVPLSEAKYNLKTEISYVNFNGISSNIKKDIDQFDKEIIFIKMKLTELELKRKLKVDVLGSIQNISNSFNNVDDIDTLIEWKSFLKENGGNFKMKLFVCGDNEHGTIGLGEKIEEINHFTEIDLFHNKKIDLI
jgi:hypothetical protein